MGRLTLLYKPSSKFDANFKLLMSNHEDRGASGEIINYSCANGGSQPTSIDYGSLYVTGWRLIYEILRKLRQNHYQFQRKHTCRDRQQLSGLTRRNTVFETVSILSSLTMNYHVTDHVTLTSITGFFKTRDTGYANFDQTDFSAAAGENNEFNTSWTEELRAYSSFSGPLNFTGGLFYEHDSRRFAQSGFVGYLPLDPATGQSNTFGSTQFFSGDTYSGYADLNWKILPKLELAGGARYTLEEKDANTGSTYLNAFLPIGSPVGKRDHRRYHRTQRLAGSHLELSRANNVLLYAAYKEGFKSGGFSEPAVIPVDATPQNQEFGQEHVHGEEVGFKFSGLANALTGDITLYDYVYSGLQLTAFDAATTSYFTQNAASALSRGVEVNLAGQISSAFSLHGSVGYSDGHYERFDNSQCWTGQTIAEGCVAGVQDLSGQRLSRAPRWSGLIGAAYDTRAFADWKLGLTVDGRYSSAYFTGTNNNPYGWQNGYETLDASVRLYTDVWEVSVVGRNLTNTIYAVFAGDKPLGQRGDVEAGIGRPREVILQVTRRF